MLHSKKSQSILQWYNSLTTKGDVNSLAQFTDGCHFYEIVSLLQPFTLQGNKEGNLSESVIFSETSIACNEVVITSVEEETAEEKVETAISESDNADPFVIKESENTDTQKKYDVIRKFINDFYRVDSSSFIDYEECQNGKELELAKVAVFLLSAMVQNLLSSEDKVVYNTTLLEPEVQENIRECLSLVLVEKDLGETQIKKSELHRILSRPASYKGTPIRKQPSRSNSDPNELSEGVRNVPKKRKERTSFIYEDVQDSPLKNLLESPKIQYKAAIYRMQSELVKLRGALVNEENKVMDFALEKKSLNETLEKKDKEIEFYKKQLESLHEEFCEKEEKIVEELTLKQIEDEKTRQLIESLKEQEQMLKDNNEDQQKKVEIEKKPGEFDGVSSLLEEISKLKHENQSMKLEAENFSETTKTLNEKVASLENELDFSAPKSRRDLIVNSFPQYSDRLKIGNLPSQGSNVRRELLSALNIQSFPRGINVEIKYFIDSSINVHLKLIRRAFFEIEERTRFIFNQVKTRPRRGILLQSGNMACTYGNLITKARPLITLPNNRPLLLGVVKHEVLHSMGLPHEHQRVVRNHYIQIVEANVHPDFKDQFKIINQAADIFYNFPYDVHSLMHYPKQAFAMNNSPRCITIRARRGSGIAVPSIQATTFSPNDLEKLSFL